MRGIGKRKEGGSGRANLGKGKLIAALQGALHPREHLKAFERYKRGVKGEN
jgi:hypothetical protein